MIAKVGRNGSISLITRIASTEMIVDVHQVHSGGLNGAAVALLRLDGGRGRRRTHLVRPLLAIRYSVQPDERPPDWMVHDIETAIVQIEVVTGLGFVRVSDTSDSPEGDPVDAGGNAKPVIIGFGTAQFPSLGGSVVGTPVPTTPPAGTRRASAASSSPVAPRRRADQPPIPTKSEEPEWRRPDGLSGCSA